MMTDSPNTDRTLVILENMQSKIEVVAEGHLHLVNALEYVKSKVGLLAEGHDQLLAGQTQLKDENRRLDSKIDNIRMELTAVEIRLSQRIDNIGCRVDRIEHYREDL